MSAIGPPDEVLAVTLARIETKLDHTISSQVDHERREIEIRADHERRIRILEARQWPLPSVAVLLSVAAIIIPLVR